jgi:hypothetical protein
MEGVARIQERKWSTVHSRQSTDREKSVDSGPWTVGLKAKTEHKKKGYSIVWSTPIVYGWCLLY